MENLTIPLKAFFEHERDDWHPQQSLNTETMQIELECGCGQTIKGTLQPGNTLLVSEFNMSGEGSGTFKGWILDEALKQSKGELEAVLVWEGGDSITRLKVKDGVIEECEVEL